MLVSQLYFIANLILVQQKYPLLLIVSFQVKKNEITFFFSSLLFLLLL